MTAVAVPSTRRRTPRWIHDAGTDAAIAFSWVPFAIAAFLASGRGDATQVLMSATLLFSFTHQPLTLALVYGDAEQFAVRRRIFTWSPLVFAVAVFVTFNVSFVTLAIVGGLWNAVHTLFQRYGIVQIYGRKVGESDGRLERALLLSWLIGAAVFAAADTATPDRIVEAGLAGHNRDALEVLTDLRPVALVLLPIAGVVAGWLTVEWVRRELRAGADANPAKQLYVASTAAVFVVMLVSPI
ncbi:MAG: hypothetical protein OEU32_16905, partial [Acidimicrobiia bacterium]|nr:hypothetical protein [Acidimicrobiia bacterium]